MIQYLKISNFGPVKDEVEMNFEVADESASSPYEIEMSDGKKLLKLAYIYGANASGKTTILQAFHFLRMLLLNPISDKTSELNYEPFLFQKDPYKKPSIFEFAFYFQEIRYVYTIKFNKKAVLNEKLVFYQSIKPTELFSRTTDEKKRLAKIQFGSKIKVPAREKDLLESNTLHNNTVMGAYSKTNVDIPALEALNKWLNKFLLGMVTANQNLTDVTSSLIKVNALMIRWINAFLNKADPQIAEVKVLDEPESTFQKEEIRPEYDAVRMIRQYSLREALTSEFTKLYNDNTQNYYLRGGQVQRKVELTHKLAANKTFTLPLSKESSGTKRYFGLGGFLYALVHNPHMLCIDELETSLHPDLMKYFLQFFLLNARSSQLLITTHNISLMENQDFIRRDALWFSEKNEDGSVSLYSAADFDSSTLRKDASIINAYKAGRLGAKPNIGSPYLTGK